MQNRVARRQYAVVPESGTLLVIGLGSVGQFASRIERHLGYRVRAVEPAPDRRTMAERHGVDTFEIGEDISACLASVERCSVW